MEYEQEYELMGPNLDHLNDEYSPNKDLKME